MRSNRQARLMQAALRERGVPAVLYSRESLFESREALELEQILVALLEVQRGDLLRAALSSEMLGWSGADLYRLEYDETQWESVLERFRGYHDAWLKRGFMPMFRTLLLEQNVPRRVLAYRDGERRLTNLLHLGEVLQQAWVGQAHTPLRLCRWLQERRARHAEEQEEYQLRLESDAEAVKLVTIHKSKGLEYPVVFVPFAWETKFNACTADSFTFHDPADGHLTLDLGSGAQKSHRIHALREELAESLRLFYVAVTRAKHRCYVIGGAFNNTLAKPCKEAVVPALGWLWHDRRDPADLPDHRLRRDLEHLAQSAPGKILVQVPKYSSQPYRPHGGESAPLHARPFRGRIGTPWQISSFTALLTQNTPDSKRWLAVAEQPEQDALAAADTLPPFDLVAERSATLSLPRYRSTAQEPLSVPRAPYTDLRDFPKGARAGEFFHSVLEHSDFLPAAREQRAAQVKRGLRRFGFDAQWQETVCELLERVLATPLRAHGETFTLGGLEPAARLNELAFYYPLAGLTPEALNTVLAAAYGGVSPDLEFADLEGFMKGFIDLVFYHAGRYYLVDYKSNFLGEDATAYEPSNLVTVMRRHHYVLQYHLYLVALHRYLESRLADYDPQRDLGGVFYLFLRGMDPARPDQGVFYAAPERYLL